MTVDKQPEALRLADLLDEKWHRWKDDPTDELKVAAELRRLHAENEDYGATIGYLTCENAEQIGEIVALKEQRDELLAALKQLAMWLPIMTEMAGMDASETQVEFSEFLDDPNRPPETISIASAMIAARAAIAKATGETK